jgi:hypothetical protein
MREATENDSHGAGGGSRLLCSKTAEVEADAGSLQGGDAIEDVDERQLCSHDAEEDWNDKDSPHQGEEDEGEGDTMERQSRVDDSKSGHPPRPLAYYARLTSSGASNPDFDDDGSELEVAEDEEI